MAGVEVEGGNFTVDKNSSAAVDEANFTYITEGVILTIVSSFGLVGNIMSIFVLMRVAVQGSFSNLLKGMNEELLSFYFSIKPYLTWQYFINFLPLSKFRHGPHRPVGQR